MQSQDENNEIIQAAMVGIRKVDGIEEMDTDDLVKKIQQAEAKGAVSHHVGRVPKAGEIITISGLSYKVEFADYVKGQFKLTLALRGPKRK